MKKIILLFCLISIHFASISQEGLPYDHLNPKLRLLVITSIRNKTAYFEYHVRDSNSTVHISGEMNKSKVIFHGSPTSGELEGSEKIIREINSKKSRLYFDFLSIQLDTYPDSLINTDMFNNYFKPLSGLNYSQLGEFRFMDYYSNRKEELPTVFFDYRSTRNWDLAEDFGRAVVDHMHNESLNDLRQKIDLSKIDFIGEIDLKQLKVYKCYIPYFDSRKLLPLMPDCRILECGESHVLNNQTILIFDSLDASAGFISAAPNLEFWNNSTKLWSYKNQNFTRDLENGYDYSDVYDFPVNYFFNTYLTYSKKIEWFNSHFSSVTKNYSGDYFVACYYCRKYNIYTDKFEPRIETSDTLLIKGKVQNGMPVGKWFVREDINAPFSVLNFDETATTPIFPEDGEWKFNYYNGQTAIKGDFKAGKKTGKWYFYAFDGRLLMMKTFKDDELNGLSEFYAVNGTKELQLYLHSNGDVVLCETEYSLESGERTVKGKNHSCFHTVENGTVWYMFSEGDENEGYIHEINYAAGTDRTIERGSKTYEEIRENLFFKYLKDN